MGNYRNQLFDICSTVQKDVCFKRIREIINKYYKVDSFYNCFNKGNPYNTELLGSIIAYQNIGNNGNFIIDKNDEHEIIQIVLFMNEIIEEALKEIPDRIKPYLNPYHSLINHLKRDGVSLNTDLTSKYSITIANLFKNNPVYKSIDLANAPLDYYDQSKNNSVLAFLNMIDSYLYKQPYDNIDEFFNSYSFRKAMIKPNIPLDPVLGMSILLFKIYTIKEILHNTIKFVYNAILNIPLLVINEKNLYNITKNRSNVKFNYKTLIVDGMFDGEPISIFDRILLLDINKEIIAYHEFGKVLSHTVNISKELGFTNEITYISYDDNLNLFPNLS